LGMRPNLYPSGQSNDALFRREERTAALARAVQDDAYLGWCKLKPVLKAPGFGFSNALKLRVKESYDELLSSFASVSTCAPATRHGKRLGIPISSWISGAVRRR
jgi:hypothetical protein